MSVKRILCIATDGNASVMAHCGELRGWDVCTVGTTGAAARVLGEQHYSVGLLLDCEGKLGHGDLDRFLRRHPRTNWIGVFPSTGLTEPALRATIADHLWDFHTTPVDAVRLNHTLGHAHGLAMMRTSPSTQPADASATGQIIGNSDAITRLCNHIRKIAAIDAPVMISGESGSGKELAAHAVHAHSPRAGGPFVAINCGAIPAALIQSELFGHERGAFTGAAKEKRGLIESASGGSIFLDEIGDLPLELQATLLRFLQERTIYRVGGTRSIDVDARVIAASHIDLQKAVAEGRFREDLYYRLCVFPLRVPALRERKEDLPMLAALFFDKYADEKGAQLKGFGQQALAALERHDWPGNVRELINRIRRAMVLAEGRLITPADLDLAAPASGPLVPEGLGDSRLQAERTAISDSLKRSGQNISRAARDLGISRMTLYRLMAKHSITV